LLLLERFFRVLTFDDDALSALQRTTVPPRATTTMRQKPARQPTARQDITFPLMGR
jgi:hypothetical protein